MKTLVTSTTIPISNRPGSYRSAEALMYADMLYREGGYDVDINYGNEKNVNDYDILALYNGMEATEKVINIYGGKDNLKLISHLEHWSSYKKEGKIISLDKNIPNYSKILRYKLEERANANTKVDFENLKEIQERSKTFHTSFNTKCVVGDSHAIVLYRPFWKVFNISYCTLNGFINKKLFGNILKENPVKEVEFFLGNIDIRHHLCRITPDHIRNTKELISRYIQYVDSIEVERKVIYTPLPIENESRVIPKTGWYDEKPFWGSWNERNIVRNIFISELKEKSKIPVIDPWDYLLNNKGELDFEYMERPRSVHLNRNSFLYWKGEMWNSSKKSSANNVKIRSLI